MRRWILFYCLLFASVAGATGQFSVSPNGRYLLKDGKPFFWMGDTGWELFHRLNRDEAETYFRKRSEQGFNVIQAVVLAEFDGLHTPNAYGETPLLNDNPETPNEKYFEQVDFIVDKAAEYHINIAMLPTWGDKIFKNTWGIGPEIFNPKNAEIFAGWLANRYKDRKNILWILGGDRLPRGENDLAIWRAMGKAIMKATANRAVISFHPQPNKLGSAEWFHHDAWLAFNMFQTGHCRQESSYDRIRAAYDLRPAKPVLDGEPIYEDHPVCFNVRELGTSNAFDVRRSLYLDLFAGAFGHTYGCHDIWQFNSPKHEPVNGPHFFWVDAMDLPGANQVKYAKQLLESFPLLERIPDQSIIREGEEGPGERIQCTRGKDYLMIYSSIGKPFHLLPGKISGNTLSGYWLDPRNGKTKPVADLPNNSEQLFTPPSSGYGQDWVLVLYNSAAYPRVK